MTRPKLKKLVTLVRNGAVATVTINTGDGRNALSRRLIGELTETARSFANDLKTQVVILTANGAFTAGFDLKDPSLDKMSGVGLLERRRFFDLGRIYATLGTTLSRSRFAPSRTIASAEALHLRFPATFGLWEKVQSCDSRKLRSA